MLLKDYIALSLSLPPKVVMQKGAALLRRKALSQFDAIRNRLRTSYSDMDAFREQKLTPLFPSPTVEELLPHKDQILYLATRACNHEFNLLGSGWVKVEYGMRGKGLEGYAYDMPPPSLPSDDDTWLREHLNAANLEEASRRYRLIKGNYSPIDWQIDFKSGFRWSASRPSTSIRYGDHLGADVKVPWELARMQHLTQLAWAHMLAAEGIEGFEPPETYLMEFQNQVLDFIALNPSRYGVNWSCTMDVAIRVSNWLIAWNFLVNSGAYFDPAFEAAFITTVHDHGKYIVNNLEWSASLRSNHYLANLGGLLFVAAFLPGTEETNAWLSLGMNELSKESILQFNSDGSNFEASTCYHRLSAEILIFGTAIACCLLEQRLQNLKSWSSHSLGHTGPGPLPPASHAQHSIFSEEHMRIIEKASIFTFAMTMPDGDNVQIGDNDSGRFFKLHPSLLRSSNEGFAENPLDHSHLLAATAGLLHSESPLEYSQVDYAVLCKIRKRPFLSGRSLRPPGDDSILTYFPDFGVAVHRSPNSYMTFRCGSVGQNGNGGHAHNDQLSITAAFAGTTFFVDPGSYLYTPLPLMRNLFRSSSMHNTFASDVLEQNQWIQGRHGLFSLAKVARVEVKEHQANRVSGTCANEHYVHNRTVEFAAEEIIITDEVTSGPLSLRLHLAPSTEIKIDDGEKTILLKRGRVIVTLIIEGLQARVIHSKYSAGYGLCCPSSAICLDSEAKKVSWKISFNKKAHDFRTPLLNA